MMATTEYYQYLSIWPDHYFQTLKRYPMVELKTSAVEYMKHSILSIMRV